MNAGLILRVASRARDATRRMSATELVCAAPSQQRLRRSSDSVAAPSQQRCAHHERRRASCRRAVTPSRHTIMTISKCHPHITPGN